MKHKARRESVPKGGFSCRNKNASYFVFLNRISYPCTFIERPHYIFVIWYLHTLEILYFFLLNHFNRCLAFWQAQRQSGWSQDKMSEWLFLQDPTTHQAPDPPTWSLFFIFFTTDRVCQYMRNTAIQELRKTNSNREKIERYIRWPLQYNHVSFFSPQLVKISLSQWQDKKFKEKRFSQDGKSDQFSIQNGKLWNKFVKFRKFWNQLRTGSSVTITSLQVRNDTFMLISHQ